jgi:hypothetical protein
MQILQISLSLSLSGCRSRLEGIGCTPAGTITLTRVFFLKGSLRPFLFLLREVLAGPSCRTALLPFPPSLLSSRAGNRLFSTDFSLSLIITTTGVYMFIN